jgi:hypothetical protein
MNETNLQQWTLFFSICMLKIHCYVHTCIYQMKGVVLFSDRRPQNYTSSWLAILLGYGVLGVPVPPYSEYYGY